MIKNFKGKKVRSYLKLFSVQVINLYISVSSYLNLSNGNIGDIAYLNISIQNISEGCFSFNFTNYASNENFPAFLAVDFYLINFCMLSKL